MMRNRGASMALGASLTLILLVGVIQILGPSIKRVDTFGVSGAIEKESQMEAIAATGSVDIVFTGTSQTLVSVDPKLIDSEAGTHTYNAALTGGTPQIQVQWLLEHVVPTLRPRQVVIGVSNLDLLDESPRLNEVIDSWNSARTNLDGPLADIDRAISDSVAVVDRRQSLRDPVEWVRAVLRYLTDTAPPIPGESGTLTEEGLELIWTDLEYHGGAEVRRFTQEEVVPEYSVGDKQSAALRNMLDGLVAEGIDVVLVMMPETQDLLDLHPNGAADVAAGERALEAIAEEAGVGILRYDNAPWPDALFADPLHLNGRGAKVLSQLIAADLAASPDGFLQSGDHSAAGDAAVASFVDE